MSQKDRCTKSRLSKGPDSRQELENSTVKIYVSEKVVGYEFREIKEVGVDHRKLEGH